MPPKIIFQAFSREALNREMVQCPQQVTSWHHQLHVSNLFRCAGVVGVAISRIKSDTGQMKYLLVQTRHIIKQVKNLDLNLIYLLNK